MWQDEVSTTCVSGWAEAVSLTVSGLSPRSERCIDRTDSKQVFGDMVNTLSMDRCVESNPGSEPGCCHYHGRDVGFERYDRPDR